MSNRSLFEGIRVIAVARQIAAPFASYQLALHGAEVITIDNPKETDSMRLVAGAGGGLNKHAMSHSFLAQAANKKSLQLDISVPRGQEIFRKLAAIESEHRDEVARRAGDAHIPDSPVKFSWIAPEGPETTEFEELHYLMTPRQALMLARVTVIRRPVIEAGPQLLVGFDPLAYAAAFQR